jgi:hypothetical protein
MARRRREHHDSEPQANSQAGWGAILEIDKSLGTDGHTALLEQVEQTECREQVEQKITREQHEKIDLSEKVEQTHPVGQRLNRQIPGIAGTVTPSWAEIE